MNQIRKRRGSAMGKILAEVNKKSHIDQIEQTMEILKKNFSEDKQQIRKSILDLVNQYFPEEE